MWYQAHPLVASIADAINGEETRHLSGEPPTGGHGYYAPGIVAAIAALRWMANDVGGTAFETNDYGAVIGRLRLSNSYLQLAARFERDGGEQ